MVANGPCEVGLALHPTPHSTRAWGAPCAATLAVGEKCCTRHTTGACLTDVHGRQHPGPGSHATDEAPNKYQVRDTGGLRGTRVGERERGRGRTLPTLCPHGPSCSMPCHQHGHTHTSQPRSYTCQLTPALPYKKLPTASTEQATNSNVLMGTLCNWATENNESFTAVTPCHEQRGLQGTEGGLQGAAGGTEGGLRGGASRGSHTCWPRPQIQADPEASRH
jgi:hypothetical protein